MLALTPIAGAPIAAPLFRNPASASSDVYAGEYVWLRKKRVKDNEVVRFLDEKAGKPDNKKRKSKELAEPESVRQTLEKILRREEQEQPASKAERSEQEAKALEAEGQSQPSPEAERPDEASGPQISPESFFFEGSPFLPGRPVSSQIFVAPHPVLPAVAMASPQEITADDADVIALIMAEEEALRQHFMQTSRITQWPYH